MIGTKKQSCERLCCDVYSTCGFIIINTVYV